MISVDDFKERLRTRELTELADELILSGPAAHVTDEQLDLIRDRLATTYGLEQDDVRILVTGSAKLGFSLVEKRASDGTVLPRYRPFDASSDIDVAVLSARLFDLLWFELSAFASSSVWFPLSHRKLGPYLVSGWLRPDHFPTSISLPNCRKWFPLFAKLSADTRFSRRKLSAGLFYSTDQLRKYQLRGLRDCLSGADL